MSVALWLWVVSIQGEAAQFEKVTGLGITNETVYSWGCAWGDYDNDGYSDLIVVNTSTSDGRYKRFLYRNNKNGTFTRMTGDEVGAIASDSYRSWDCAWADYNNDGFLDISIASTLNSSAGGLLGTKLYKNRGDGSLFPALAGDLTSAPHAGMHFWADYDADGNLDVFVASGWRPFKLTNMLFHASGNGTFKRVFEGPIVTDRVEPNNAAWVDYNNDGRPDLYLAVYPYNATYGVDCLYRNDGQGKFTSVTNVLTIQGGHSQNPAWGDYDNDGDLDVAIDYLSSSGQGTRLFRNDGNDEFTLVKTWSTKPGIPAWVDCNNDGYLDLYDIHGQGSPQRSILYQNNGDGTFTSVSDAVTADTAGWISQAWSDYDNDGFMDVFVTEQWGRNALYHNLGNTNHWIKFKLVGTASNRSAIVTKVRVNATIGGTNFWQMREVSSGGLSAQDDMRPNFGLGDATVVDLVRIEWPSGNVQELVNQTPDRVVTVTEPVRINPARPTASLGGSVTLTSVSTGLEYQWQFNSVDLVGETNRTINLKNIVSDQEVASDN